MGSRLLAQYNEEPLNKCDLNPFAAGCRIGGVGPVISTDSEGNFYGGLGAYFGYFLVNRVSLAGSAGATFSRRYSVYSAGPDLRIHLGSVMNFIFQVGYGYSFVWVRGATRANGSVQGPSASILLPAGKKIFLGMTAGYYTHNWGSVSYSEVGYSPAVAIYF